MTFKTRKLDEITKRNTDRKKGTLQRLSPGTQQYSEIREMRKNKQRQLSGVTSNGGETQKKLVSWMPRKRCLIKKLSAW
jgi:hypothetical protein